jgi:electron transfer flavoprotein alpha subunit
MTVLVLVELDRGTLAPSTLEALAFARSLDAGGVEAVALGVAAEPLAAELAAHGAAVVYVARHELLVDYGPEAWGHALAAVMRALEPDLVLASGSDVGNEVLAHAAAITDQPFAANCTEVTIDGSTATLTRQRWGGSLLEDATITGMPLLLSVAPHTVNPIPSPVAVSVTYLDVEIPAWAARTVVADRVERAAGLTLATAPVVVGGGRGVGSAEGFAPLEELAVELGGVVGCSRAVTNNGWRNHTDQVGQTGTRIAPEVYLACGISGAIQHWVGAMASKHIIAVNTDADANMVSKAGYAVIGDLHAVVPAITAEIRKRRQG